MKKTSKEAKRDTQLTELEWNEVNNNNNKKEIFQKQSFCCKFLFSFVVVVSI